MNKQEKYAVYQKVILKRHLTEKKLKTYSTILLIIAILAFLLGIPTISVGGIIFIIVGLIELYISILYRKCAKACFKNGVPVQFDSPCNESNPVVNSNVNNTPRPEPQVEKPVSNVSVLKESVHQEPVNVTEVKTPVTSEVKPVENKPKECKTENHRVAGITHYEDEVLSLAIENSEYEYTRKELVDFYMIDERIYQYIFPVSKVELIAEPDNQYDPNAVKVLADGVQIGYIKKGSCSHIKNLIRDNKIKNIHAFIGGGKYKCVEEDYDYEKDKDVYSLEKGSTNYFCEITLDLCE